MKTYKSNKKNLFNHCEDIKFYNYKKTNNNKRKRKEKGKAKFT